MALSTSRKLMLTKAIVFVVGGTFLLFLLQLYSSDQPMQMFSLQISPMQEQMELYSEEESVSEASPAFQGDLTRRVDFKGTNATLWDKTYPRQECNPRLFPTGHWTGLKFKTPDNSSQESTNHTGQQLYGSIAAQHAIWSHQHPKNCSDKKFIAYEALGPEHGIGTILHHLGVALQAAIDLDRILVLYPQPNYEWVNGWFCTDTSALDECYFEPLSSCTIADAFGDREPNLDNLWRYSELSLESYHCDESDPKFSERLLGTSLKEVMKTFDTPTITQHLRSETPHMFHTLLKAGNISENSFYWWRAQSIAYIVRPNARLLNELKNRRNYFYILAPLEPGTISVHIPYSHHLKDQRTASNEAYLQSAESLVSRYPNDLQRRIFLTTEDPDAISFFSKLTNWNVSWTNVTRIPRNEEITDPNAVLNNFASRFGWDEEFINSFLNLDVALECDGFVGQLSSHWNRLIDELRSTVRCKYDRAFVDVVQGFNISNYFW
ncbi:hypothetical protein M758_2G099200 [Ceratodon purpureus]|nr:hypothetical protein M758_2G099200 [Ceratodon purpureus]